MLSGSLLNQGSVANKVIELKFSNADKFEMEVVIEHVSGNIISCVNVDTSSGSLNFPKASFVRTARPLFEGDVIVPGSKSHLKI